MRRAPFRPVRRRAPPTATLRAIGALLALAAGAAGAQDLPPLQAVPPVAPATARVRLETVLDGLRLPVSATTAGDGSGRLFIVQLEGLVRVWQDGRLLDRPFLDLRGLVTGLSGEDGFYSIAFHPDFARNGRVFAAYTRSGSDDLVVMEYRADAARAHADPASFERLVLRVPVDEPFHHGGQVVFGPDGMLYVSTGDGQEANHWLHEPPFVSQDLSTLRGKILRIDVDRGTPYAVPADNPFVGRAGVRGEIWAYGFRNPWKMAFDPADGTLYASDVGNDRWEEIDRVERGADYGWPAREGPECQLFPEVEGMVDPACGQADQTPPAAAYGHPGIDPAGGNAVVGGAVYHGSAFAALQGRYLYGDYVSGRIWSLEPAAAGDRVELLLDTDEAITAFATGPDGELYVLSLGGRMARLEAR